jgi:hypothetical protein
MDDGGLVKMSTSPSCPADIIKKFYKPLGSLNYKKATAYLDFFNNSVRSLFTITIKLMPKTNPFRTELKGSRRKASIAMTCNESVVSSVLGPYLVRFMRKIIDRNEEFFLNMDLKSIPELADFHELTTTLKNLWKTLSTDERVQFFEIFSDMLTAYLTSEQLSREKKSK